MPFAERPLTGNPATVCPLEAWLPAATMQAIACEMNLSETAFFAQTRWAARKLSFCPKSTRG
jgi:predicted PhzF superfamily epimerase YddE/YHI9